MALLPLLLLAASPQQVIATDAPDWDAMFDRDSGWTGADGVYSIPLNGNDQQGSGTSTRTVFVFSDTFVGDVGLTGERLPGTTVVSNSLGLLQPSGVVDPANLDFYWGTENGAPAAAFVPTTSGSLPGEYYSLKDGIAIGTNLHLFAGRFESITERRGVAMITVDTTSSSPVATAVQVEAPLFAPRTAQHEDFTFGSAFLDNSVEAGAPFPDGFVYCYGVEEPINTKKALVARVPRAQFTDFSAWTYWDGATWSANIDDAKDIAGRVGREYSVTPLPTGKFVMVTMLDGDSGDIAYRLADTPQGPWGPPQVVYSVDLPPGMPNLFAYNAKAHPNLSAPGELLVSYEIDSTDVRDHFDDADIYRPRFIRLTLQ